jgi:hypothetical protein
MIDPEAKFLSSCEPIKPELLFASKMQWWNRYQREDRPIPKGRNERTKVVTGPTQLQNLIGQNLSHLKV